MTARKQPIKRQAPEHFSIETAQHDTFRQWGGDRETRNDALFPNMTAMFVFCAALGHAAGVRRPLQAKKTILFRWSQLATDVDLPVLTAVAAAESKGLDVVADDYTIMQIAQECAAGGVDLLKSKLAGNREKNLQTLAALALELGTSEG